MAEFGDRQRIRPTVEGRARLLAAVEIVSPPHVIEIGTLGEYADLVLMRGQREAAARMPEVAAHLADGCDPCADDLAELQAMLGGPDNQPPAAPARGPTPPSPGSVPESAPALSSAPLDSETGSAETESAQASPPSVRPLVDSGLHVAGLPDPRAGEAAEAARRVRLRKIRDWLLIAAAVSILLIGLSLVGMAYMASGQSGPIRLALTPVTSDSQGQAVPSGLNCPSTHPIKGNRDSMIYHRPGQAFYDQTRPEVCFATPADAEAAGYRASQR
jgi:hypothetical protein